MLEKVLASPLPDAATALDHVWAPIAPGSSPMRRDIGECGTIAMHHELYPGSQRSARRVSSRPGRKCWSTEKMSGRRAAYSAPLATCSRPSARSVYRHAAFRKAPSSGSAVGAALMGMKPIVEIMWADFHAGGARSTHQPGGECSLRDRRPARSLPIVVRTQQGATPVLAPSIRRASKLCSRISRDSELRCRPRRKTPTTSCAPPSLRPIRASCLKPEGSYQIFRSCANLRPDSADREGHREEAKATGAAIVTWGTMLGSRTRGRGRSPRTLA